MRILVIGGTGFIGPPVIHALIDEGHEVTVYHRGEHESALPTSVRHVHHPAAGIPVTHFPDALLDPAPEVVLHMFPVGQDDATALVNRFRGLARRVVGISSGDVYRAYGRLRGTEPGPPEPVPIDEDAPLRTGLYPYRSESHAEAAWTYGYEKILAERALRAAPELFATILRLPAVYGPGDAHHRFRPCIKRMLDGRPRILLDEGLAAWRWTHGYVADVARAVALAVTNERAAGRTYNVGETDTPTMSDRVEALAEAAGWTGVIEVLPAERLPPHLGVPFGTSQHLVMDSRRLREELGWEGQVPPGEALKRTIDWEARESWVPGDPTEEIYRIEEGGEGGVQG
jgi:nucleoside-diphosphate-sugar epimerase